MRRLGANWRPKHNVALVSDEIYRMFCYDEPFVSPATFNPETLVIDGFSKSYGMTGWRVGFAHGPAAIVDEMIKLQQYTFVCAPQPFQWAGAAALDVDMQSHVADYRRKRDRFVAALGDRYEISHARRGVLCVPQGALGNRQASSSPAAIEHELLIIPGNIFSRRDTHFRISYAASDETIERGLEVLLRMASER